MRGAGDRKRVNLRADALESLIAAIYLEGGLDAARNFITRHWSARSSAGQRGAARSQDRAAGMGASGRRRRPGLHDRQGREGPDHDPLFTISVQLTGFEPATGSGRTKRQAEQAAASAILAARRRLETGRQPHDRNGRTAEPTTHSGFVALIGAPNAGKSTLVNRLVGTKVSIVTHKVQTTRAIIRGIATHGNAQIVFLDTPGIFKPKRALDRAMVTTAWGGAKDADIVLVLIDAERGIKGDADAILDGLWRCAPAEDPGAEQGRPVQAGIAAEADQPRSTRAPTFARTFMVSALTGSGCGDLLDYLAEALPAGPWYYPEDQVSDLPMRQLAAEITREKLYLRLHQELPYSSHVETERWEEKKDGSVGSSR